MICRMLLALWMNIFVDLGNTNVCDETDWQQALSTPGWANCSKAYVNGLRRGLPVRHDGIDRITAARCCDPPPEYMGKTLVCQLVDWSALLSKTNTWATCPDGFFLNGIYRSHDTWLYNVEQAKCCRPAEHNDTKSQCYDQDVALSFDKEGLSKCNDGFYLVGVYRSGCDLLHCIEAFKCCKITKETKVLGHWLLNGEEPDIRYNGLSTFVEGRCPGSKALKFHKSNSFVSAPIIHFNDRSFVISCWINVDDSNTIGSIYSDWIDPWQFSLGIRNKNVIFSRHSKGEEKWWSLESSAIPLNTWIHVAVDWQHDEGTVRIYVDGQQVAYKVITPKKFHKPTGNAYRIGMDGNDQQFYGSVMELYVFGTTLTEKKLEQLRGFPVITVQVHGSFVDVMWKPPFQEACPVSIYTIYYRTVTSAIEKNQWNMVNVTGNGTRLSFQCSKEYEVTVTAWTSRGETPLNHSTPLLVATGGDLPLPPVIQNKEVEISGCDVNLTWSASQESSCPLTMFTIYYHEIASPLKEHAGHEINVSSVTKTSFLLSLQCDKQYGFEISAWNDAGESDKSRLWPIMTRSGSENVTLFHGTLSTKKTPPVNFQGSGASMSLSDRQVAGLISGVSAIAVVSLLVFFYRHRQGKKQSESNTRTYRRSKYDIIVLEHQETPPHRVTFMEELGRGAFGVVYKGLLKRSPGVEVFCEGRKQAVAFKEQQTVAIKVLAGTASEETKEQFLEEIELMKRVGTHRNVLSMVGFWEKSAPIFLLLEYVPFGDLLQWLQEKRKRSTQKNPQISIGAEQDCKEINFSDKENKSVKSLPWTNKVDLHNMRGSATLIAFNEKTEESHHLAESRGKTSKIYEEGSTTATVIPANESCKDDAVLEEDFSAKDLLCFAWQTARGMSFLSNAGFVHRDLAARNVLLGEGKVIKISDFGLMRHMYGDIYEMKRRKKLPIKWTAPEALYSSLYTSKSDVWSYGVLLWELSTMGGTPYPGVDNKELYKLLKTGFRLDKPDTCSDELYKVMSDCWHEEPNERPTFEELMQTFEEMMTQGTPYLDLECMDVSKACYAEKLSDSDDSEKSGSECA